MCRQQFRRPVSSRLWNKGSCKKKMEENAMSLHCLLSTVSRLITDLYMHFKTWYRLMLYPIICDSPGQSGTDPQYKLVAPSLEGWRFEWHTRQQAKVAWLRTFARFPRSALPWPNPKSFNVQSALTDALLRLFGTHYRKLSLIVTLLLCL